MSVYLNFLAIGENKIQFLLSVETNKSVIFGFSFIIQDEHFGKSATESKPTSNARTVHKKLKTTNEMRKKIIQNRYILNHSEN